MARKLPLADIKFLTDFHAFALNKGDESYDYCRSGMCALAQFLLESGRVKRASVGGWGYWSDDEGQRHAPPEGLHQALNPGYYELDGMKRSDWTFAKLATRLEALLADSPVVTRAGD